MKTFLPKTDANQKKWYLVDADGKTLGRLAAQIAVVLRGKHKPTFTPSLDAGDFVVVVNAEKVHFTGKKYTDKIYYHHSQYPNGLKSRPMGKVLEENPGEVLKKAVWGMLPKGPLGRDMFKKLKVYSGSAHPHQAQGPEALSTIN
ncbi:MAG: 50S ribosomal protein L13 [Deltaproteobacteria bacterium]|nr:50S ribosomal protein L13 [Deltaproteobacteria bacterium]